MLSINRLLSSASIISIILALLLLIFGDSYSKTLYLLVYIFLYTSKRFIINNTTKKSAQLILIATIIAFSCIVVLLNHPPVNACGHTRVDMIVCQVITIIIYISVPIISLIIDYSKHGGYYSVPRMVVEIIVSMIWINISGYV